MKRACLCLLPAAAALLAPSACGCGERPAYPATRVVDVVDDYHGTAVADPYRWLEDEADPEVRAWVAAQNALTRSALGRFPEREALRRDLERLYSASVASSPTLRGKRFFYTRREGLKNQPYVYVSEGAMGAGERLLLDPNTFSADGTVARDWAYPSPDGSLYLYGRSASGSEKSTLHILDVAGGHELPDTIAHMRGASVAWTEDGKGFYYVRYPEPGSVPAGDEDYHRRVYFHRLGRDPRQDELIHGEGRPKEEWCDVTASSDWRTLLLTRSVDWAKNDLLVRPLDGGRELVPVAVGLDGQTYGDVRGDQLYLRTSVEAARYRIVRAPLAAPGPENWVEVVPEGDGVIEDFGLAGERLVVQVLEDAHSRILVFDLQGKRLYEVALPALGTVKSLSTAAASPDAYFEFESYAHPTAVLRLDTVSGRLATVEQLECGVDLTGLETRQEWYTSKDGTRVPLFVVEGKGAPRDGRAPALLSGYGGFEISTTPSFDVRILPWLERGGVFAEACLRGGGEFGRAWHEAGRLERKQNVFDDFHAAAEYLVDEGYTSPERLAVWGGSNGGLLTGACVVQRPDLIRAAVVAVPLLDMLRYENFAIARLWIPEYGTAQDPGQFPFLYAYSPYHHVIPGTEYPAVLLTTAESDSRVAPLHAMKMAARLQAATGGDLPVLLRVEPKAGHGQGKPLSKRIGEWLDISTFLFWQTGVWAPPAGASGGSAPVGGGGR